MFQDLTFAIRTLRRDPGYAATAILWILLSATAIVIALTFVAILVPARRAAKAERSAILRQE